MKRFRERGVSIPQLVLSERPVARKRALLRCLRLVQGHGVLSPPLENDPSTTSDVVRSWMRSRV